MELARSMRDARGFGWVFCDWRRRVSEGEAGVHELDEFVFAALGSESDRTRRDGYREVTAGGAQHIVAHWMQHSMAYGKPLSGSGLVSEVVEPFFRLLPTARYFTNTSVTSASITNTVAGWQFTPKTQHTFDSGIVAADAVHIGMVWFADED
jgi:hypothetical protein